MACAGITQRAQRCARFSEAAKTHLTNRAVMLSGAKHLCLFPFVNRPDLIRDSSPATAGSE
jgi:hypothetical protein